MNNLFHDFVTVDMRGLKAALVARSQTERVSVSVLVRAAVARDFGSADGAKGLPTSNLAGSASGAACVKLSIRMTQEEARQLAAGAHAAGLSRGAYLAGLVANIPVLSGGGNRTDHLVALIESNAELSTLSRNIRSLTSLLREGNVRRALEYRAMLDTLANDVRDHLKLASGVLAGLRPRVRSADASKLPTT